MDTVPAGAVRRSEGGEVPMELTLVRATNRRFQMWIPLLLAFGFVLVAAVPLAAGGGDQPLAASMLVSRTQASPGDNVTFWIWITPLKEKARNLIVTESNLDGFAVVSSEAPGSCLQTQLTWVCVQDELRPFAIGSMELLFNATVPSSNRVDHVELGVAATYQAADGGVVRVETKPSSFSLLPLPSGPRVWPLQVGMVLAVLAFVGRSLFLPQGPIGSARTRAPGAEEVFLLHRSGILLKHFSSDPTRGIDSDILGGMLAAVRMFVEDSMHPSAGPLQEIRFRGGSIVFVTGKNAAVAALNARGNHTLFTHRARGILRDFERRNGDALTNFDGVAGRLDGVDALLGRIAS